MTWSDCIAEGGGPIEYRWVVEGGKYQFVTALEMRGACYGASILPAAGAVTWTAGGVVITTGVADPLGGTNAVTLQDDNPAAIEFATSDSGAYRSGAALRGEVWVARSSTNFVEIRVDFGGATLNGGILVNPATGASTVWGTGVGLYTSVEVDDTIVDGWWRVRFAHSGAAAATAQLRVMPACGTTYPSRSSAALGSATFYAPKIQVADGRRRVVGLQRDGLGFTETAYLAGAELDVGINPVTIVETPEPDLNAATEVFSKIPAVLAWLDTSVSTAATSATVLDATDLSVGDYVHVGTEVWLVTAIVGAVATIERAQWGTSNQAHNVTSTTTAATQQVPLIDGVEIWTKRRWWLYAHGPSELGVTDEGELVMQGVIAGEPEEAGGEWTISLDSRMALLEQEVAASVDVERKIRGIYYPGTAPLRLFFRQSSDTTFANAPYAGDPSVALSGFWETQGEFCFALQDALNNDPTVSAWATWECIEIDGRWELFYTTPAVDPRYIWVWGGSPVDGDFQYRARYMGATEHRTRGDEDHGVYEDAVSASARYLCLWSVAPAWWEPSLEGTEVRGMPRTLSLAWRVDGAPDTDAQVAAFPAGAQYLDNVIGLSAGDTLLVPQGEPGTDEPPLALTISSVSLATGSVVAYAESSVDSPSGIVAAGAAAEAIVFSAARRYGDDTGTDLAGFMAALLADAPDGANDAATPWITSDDVASWATVIAEASGTLPYLARRLYVFSKGQRLEDVIKQECRMYGVFPYLDADFRIALRRLTVETAAVASGLHVTGNDHLVDERRSEIRSGTDGNVNVYELSRGYDPTEDKYLENPIHVQNVAGVARAKARRVLEVRPKTRSAGAGNEPTPLDAARMADPVTTLFGGKIIHVLVDVPLSFWDVRLGDSILLTDETAPHDGARGLHDPGQGLASRRAIVVGRDWRLDNPGGTFTCLLTGLDVAGYSPSARVTAASGATDSWTLTVAASHYAPSGSNDDEFFAVEDRIRLIEWDADSPTTILGVVDSVNTATHEIGVHLDGAWAGMGGAIYNLCSAPYDDSDGLAEAQRDYAYIASSTLRLDDGGGGSVGAKLFAP